MILTVAALLIGTVNAFSIRLSSPRCAGKKYTSPRCIAPLAEALAAPLTEGIWDLCRPIRVEGNTLKTWDLGGESTERVQLSIRSPCGRPIEAEVELWHTPSYTPTKIKVYCEDGEETPFHTIIETPTNTKTVAVFNVEGPEFPIEASVASTGLGTAMEALAGTTPALVQGGQVTSYILGPEVESVAVLLTTRERNMKAMIEITQGPDDDNQVIELDSTVGHENPFYTVILTPGGANTLRIVNEHTVEFPFDAYVLPCEGASEDAAEVVVGSGDGFY